MRKDSIKAQIQRVRRAARRRDNATGQLYNAAEDRSKVFREVTMYSLFVSDENTFILRPHVFSKRAGRTPQQWGAYFDDHYGEILRENILPGMHNRTDGKNWRLYRIVGWIGRVHIRSKGASVSKKRNKTKPQRRTRG